MAVFAALSLLDADDHLRRIDVAGLQLDDFAGAEARTVGEAERSLSLEADGHRQ